jgi:hypothetical protein
MAKTTNAKFDVTNWDEQPFDDQADAPKVTTARVTKSYTGGITGESTTLWTMAYADDESATFVGFERFRGEVDGKQGTLVLRHIGTFENGVATADLSVLSGCGTDELAGARGTGDFRADPAGSVALELTFAK